PGERLPPEARRLAGPRKISGQESDSLCGKLGGGGASACFVGAVMRDDVRAVASERGSDRRADTLRCAGHQNGLTVEPAHAALPSIWIRQQDSIAKRELLPSALPYAMPPT